MLLTAGAGGYKHVLSELPQKLHVWSVKQEHDALLVKALQVQLLNIDTVRASCFTLQERSPFPAAQVLSFQETQRRLVNS